MSILVMDNFSFGEGYVRTGLEGIQNEKLDPEFLAPIGGRLVRYRSTTSTTVQAYGTIEFKKVEMLRNGEVAERPAIFLSATNVQNVNYRLCTGIYLQFPETKSADSDLWFGMRFVHEAYGDDYASSDAKNSRLGISVWQENSSYSGVRSIRRIFDINSRNEFEIDRQAESDAGAGRAVFPRHASGKPFFVDVRYVRATGDLQVWVDNIYCGELTKWYWSNSPANRAKYLFIGLDETASRMSSGGVYLTDYLVAEDDGEGWCGRFGPDTWVESHTPTADTVNQWERPSGYQSNFSVVEKSTFTALDTTETGNQDYLHTTQVGALDAYRGDVYLRENILGVSSQSVVLNAGSAIHVINPAFATTDETLLGEDIVVTPGTSTPFPTRSLTTINPATGEPFTKEEITSMSLGFKVQY